MVITFQLPKYTFNMNSVCSDLVITIYTISSESRKFHFNNINFQNCLYLNTSHLTQYSILKVFEIKFC